MKNNGENSGQGPNKGILSRTLFVGAMCGIVAFFVLAVKLFQVMIIQHDYYEGLAVESQTQETTVAATRGTIYDSKGDTLAMSAGAENIFISPAEIEKYDEDINLIANFLHELLGVEQSKIIEMAQDTDYWYKTVATAQPSSVTDQVRQFKEDNNIVGEMCIRDRAQTERGGGEKRLQRRTYHPGENKRRESGRYRRNT